MQQFKGAHYIPLIKSSSQLETRCDTARLFVITYMALSVHVDARGLPSNARFCYARLSTSSETRYTCRQHSRNPSWSNSLLISDSAEGTVHVSVHTQVSSVEDGLLGLEVFDVEALRRQAPVVLERRLANNSRLYLCVENIKTNSGSKDNSYFTFAVTCSRLRRRIVLGNRGIPLVLIIFRAPEATKGDWIPVFRAYGSSQGNMVFFDDAHLDLFNTCLGQPSKTLRIALFRIDSHRKFKLIAFHETALTALQMLPLNGNSYKSDSNYSDGVPKTKVVSQPLQGKFFDDEPGVITFNRSHDTDGTMRISLRFDVFNAPEFISSYSRPRRLLLPHQQKILQESFDEGNEARSRRMTQSFSLSIDERIEKTSAYEKPPPSSRGTANAFTGRRKSQASPFRVTLRS